MALGIGLIGLGWITRKIHLPFFEQCNDVTKIAIYDINSDTLDNNHFSKKIIKMSSLDEMLQDDEINAVLIATPNYLHSEQIIRSLKAGKTVLCEKPLCTNKEEIDLLLQMSRSYPNKLIPLLPNRHREDIMMIKTIIGKGIIGGIYKVKAHWVRTNGIPGSSWFLNSSFSGGGVLIDLGSHLLDLLQWLCQKDEVVSVSTHFSKCFLDSDHVAYWHNNDTQIEYSNVEDNFSGFVEFKTMSWSIDLSWAEYIDEDETIIELFGEKGSIKYKGLLGFSSNISNEVSTVSIITESDKICNQFDFSNRVAPYRSMLQNAITVIENSGFSSISPEEVFGTLNLIMEMYSRKKLEYVEASFK